MRGGRRSTSFKPGNKVAVGKGRPKKAANETAEAIRKTVVTDIKAAAKEASPEALKALKDVIANEKAPAAARVGAAVAILDRGWGKPQQTVEVTQSVFDQMTDDEQKAMLAALAVLKAQDEDRPETLN
jgi:hypothetical protein